MSKEVSLIDYDKETEAISKYEHYSVGFHNTFGDIRSLHVRLTPLIADMAELFDISLRECNSIVTMIAEHPDWDDEQIADQVDWED